MSEINDGGAAFPQPCTEDGYAANTPYQIAGGGMSLRDYFASKAMPVALDAAWRDEWCFDGFDSFDEMIASTAYAMADAMLAERDKQK